jgi:hypothetical protein
MQMFENKLTKSEDDQQGVDPSLVVFVRPRLWCFSFSGRRHRSQVQGIDLIPLYRLLTWSATTWEAGNAGAGEPV